MKLNEFVRHFNSVAENGVNEYMALCPAHDDHNPSLSIGLSPDSERIFLHCYAGCETKNILNSVGLTLKDLYINQKGSNIMKKTTYTYHKADGTIAYTKTRTDYEDGSKKFYFEQPDGTKSVKGIQHELYNLPAVLTATKVYFVEGEKCADAVIKQGAVATTLDTGAKSPWCPHYTDYLKDKEVIIIPDNDTPGTNYAKKILQNVPNARIVKLPDLSEKGDIYDWLNMGHTMAEVDKLPTFEIAEEITAPITSHSDSVNTGDFKNETQAETIIRLVEEKDTILFHDNAKDPYAAVMIDGHREVWLIDGGDFVTWLNNLYYNAEKKPAKKDSLSQAKEVLKARAVFENTKAIPLETRVAQLDNAFWYNLSNDDWNAVKITKDGWEIVDNPPILFRRHRHQKCQYQPSKNGDIRKILNYINLQDNHTMFLCWLVCCFVPNIPHAMPIFFGEKGAAKTTACTLLKKLIDPSALETLTIQKNPRSLAVNLQQHWFLPFDNVSRIDEETSDTLCRAITGGGIQQRKLFTDADDYIFTFQKCLALNGINNVANRPDLLDRAILVELSRIEENKRRELSELMADFEKDLPYILGGVIDTLSKAMSLYPTVKLDTLPRMADFARWGYAIGEALGGLGNEFLEQYNANQGKRNIEVLNTDIVATLVVAFMKDRAEWSGLISELYNQLSAMAPQYGINSKGKEFPTVPNVLSRRLNGLKSNLQEAGISFKTCAKMNGTEITLTNEKIPQVSSYCDYQVKFDGKNAPVSVAGVDNSINDTEDTEDIQF
ncbi:MAG: hypothetical protein E7541_01150 [Ruminococcaceae bacterium]|nr:hypothetical protein [Oscillospiraceae bacterium]